MIDFSPSYLIVRTTGRSATMKVMIQPVCPASLVHSILSKRAVFHSVTKSRCSDSGSYISPFLVKINARRVSCGTFLAPRKLTDSMVSDGGRSGFAAGGVFGVAAAGAAGLAGSGLDGAGSWACGTCSNGLGGLGCCGAGCC